MLSQRWTQSKLRSQPKTLSWLVLMFCGLNYDYKFLFPLAGTIVLTQALTTHF